MDIADSLEDPSNLEIETPMAIVTHRSGDENRTKYRVHEKPTRNIHWEIRWAWTGREACMFSPTPVCREG